MMGEADVTPGEVLRLIMRVAHVGAMAVWFGSAFFYLLSRPLLAGELNRAVWRTYRARLGVVARRCMGVLIASGAYLAFDRLSDPRRGAAYVVVLVVKLALVAAIIWIAGARRAPPPGAAAGTLRPDPAQLLLALGAGALILGVVLAMIYEAELRGF